MVNRISILSLIVLGIAALVMPFAAHAQTTWYVDDDAPNDPAAGDPSVSDPLEDGSAGHPFDAIQEGIDAAVDGDAVLVLDGTYTGNGNRDLDFGGKAITVRSENGADSCVIDCEGDPNDLHAGLYFHSGEGPDSVVEGLTITNGYTGSSGDGVYCHNSSPTLADCTISGNSGYSGSAVYCSYSGASFNHCTISGNSAVGVYCSHSSPTLTHCTINGNSGRGVYCTDSTPTLINCTISRNSVDSHQGGFYCHGGSPALTSCTISDNSGRGIDCNYATSTLFNCTISGNSGYGVDCNHATPTLSNCTISANSGSGVYCDDSSPTITNCAISGNSDEYNGCGVFCFDNSSPMLTNCTINGNSANRSGGGVFCYYNSSPTLTNCILWDNTPEEIYADSDSSPLVSYCDVRDGWAGAGNIDADPLFAFADDFHLMPGSPCIDVGTNDPPGGLPAEDQEGNPRPLDGDGDLVAVADIGAYEFNPAAPSIALSPPACEFVAPEGGDNPADQTLLLRNSGVGTLSWEITGQPAWLTIWPATGESSGEVNEVLLRVDISGMPHGEYTAAPQVLDPQAGNSPRELFVTLYVGRTLDVPSEHPTIQAAIDAANEHDFVEIADGTYTGAGNRDLDFGGKAITVRGASGDPALCIIDCAGDPNDPHRGFYFHHYEGPDSILEGLTITNGIASGGGGVSCTYSSPTITNCVITGNRSTHSGGGVCCADSNATIVNCVIAGNRATYDGGGVLCNDSNVTITGCKISGNSADCDGGGISKDDGDLTLSNCQFSGNAAPSGVGGAVHVQHWSDGALTLVNCTFSTNMAFNGGGVYSHDELVTIANCIFWNNSASTFDLADGSSVTHSCVQGGYPGVGNIDVDPLLSDADGPDDILGTEDDDLHLLPGSPCIDAADSDAVPPWLATDSDGEDRIMGCRVDMGADESAAIGADCNGNGYSDGCDVFDGTSDDFDLDGIPDVCQDCNGNGVPDRCDADCDVGNCAGHPLGCGGAADCNGNGMADECEGSGILYVDDDAAGSRNGTTWADAYNDPSYALRLAACAGAVTEIRVAAGTYRPSIAELTDPREATFQLVNGVAVRGGYRGLTGGGDPNDRDIVGFESVLSGDMGVPGYASDNCYHVVTGSATDETAVFDGFTVTAGNANHEYDWYKQRGGGLYCYTGDPTVINCAFVANAGRTAGGVCANDSHLVMLNCLLCRNSSVLGGGGMVSSAYGNTTLVNCAFLGNTAGGLGGGMGNFFYGSSTLVNCVFVGNTAAGRGGGMANDYYSQSMLANCTFSGNSASTAGAIYNSAAGQAIARNCIFWGDTLGEINCCATLSYTCIFWGWPGDGNLDADPLFVRPPSPGPDGEWGTPDDDYGDLRLQPGSPCIDAGDNTAVPLDVLDLDSDGYADERTPFDFDGNPRFVQDPFSDDTGVPDPPRYWHIVDMGAYEYQFCFGDLDEDNDIDITDVAQLLCNYGETAGATYYDGDLDGDGDVDLADLAELLGAYGTVCE